MALKTSVQCVLTDRVGFAATDAYPVDGSNRATRVALYESTGTYMLQIDEHNVHQFSDLSTNTDYILKTVYMNAASTEMEGVVPDTTVEVKTKQNSDFVPSITVQSGKVSVAEIEDSVWFPTQVLLTGFGVGMALCDTDDNVLDSSYETPCTLHGAIDDNCYVIAFIWTGQRSSRSLVDYIDDTAVYTVRESEEVGVEATEPKIENEFKDFWIAVGEPGAYRSQQQYDKKNLIALNRDFHIKIQHAPYSPMSKIKNVVVQSWKDEDGDDVWLPRVTDSETGKYIPAVTHEAVDYTPRFVFYVTGEDGEFQWDANQVINELVKRIEGRWLKVWDEYTQIGYDGVYLVDVDDDPKFKRRGNYVHVEFELKFKINGVKINGDIFDNVGDVEEEESSSN